MASEDDARDALVEALTTVAKQAGKQTSGTYAENFASSARQLAEAIAWLDSPRHAG